MTALAVIGKITAAKWILFAPKEPTRLRVFFVVLWDVNLSVDGAIAVVDIRRVQEITVVTKPAEPLGIMSARRDALFPIVAFLLFPLRFELSDNADFLGNAFGSLDAPAVRVRRAQIYRARARYVASAS